MKDITLDELEQKIALHEQWMQDSKSGQRADLSNYDLTGHTFDYKTIKNANFNGSNLTRTSFKGAVLHGCNFSGCDFSDSCLNAADLSYAILCSANISWVSCRHAKFYDCIIRNTNFTNADLSCADLSFVNAASTARFNCAILEGANFLLVGQDERSFFYYAYADFDNVVNLHAGCRHFVGIEEASRHWHARHYNNPLVLQDCLSLLERTKSMAIAKGWRTEPREEETTKQDQSLVTDAIRHNQQLEESIG